MPNKIDIEYCGAWGYGGPATNLKKKIEADLGVEVNSHSANGVTGTIKVSWVKDGKLETVWEKNKADTVNGHDEILKLLKSSQWAEPLETDRLQMKSTSETWGVLWGTDDLFHKTTLKLTNYLIETLFKQDISALNPI